MYSRSKMHYFWGLLIPVIVTRSFQLSTAAKRYLRVKGWTFQGGWIEASSCPSLLLAMGRERIILCCPLPVTLPPPPLYETEKSLCPSGVSSVGFLQGAPFGGCKQTRGAKPWALWGQESLLLSLHSLGVWSSTPLSFLEPLWYVQFYFV